MILPKPRWLTITQKNHVIDRLRLITMEQETEQKKLEFLASRSRQSLNDQIESYTGNHNKAGRIITVNALFTSFFLFLLKEGDTSEFIVYASIIPFLLLFFAIYFLLQIFVSRKIHQGFKPKNYDIIYYMSYEEVLNYELSANISSIEQNAETVFKQNRRLNWGIALTYLAGVIFTILIIVSQASSMASIKF